MRDRIVLQSNLAPTLAREQDSLGHSGGSFASKERLQALDFFDDKCTIAQSGAGGEVGRHSWDGAHSTTEVDGKWGHVQRPKVSNLVGGVDCHLSLLDKRYAKDGVDGDVGTSGNQE